MLFSGAALLALGGVLGPTTGRSDEPRPTIRGFTPAGAAWQGFAFVLFRVFDIVKPPPIRYYERKLPGGLGVMFDDLLAAFYTLLVLAITRTWIGS